MKKKQSNLTSPNLEYDLLNQGYTHIIGIDEAGRGPWAGPVYVCAYVFNKHEEINKLVTDSKKLSIKKREEIAENISKDKYILAIGDVETIDELGIYITVINLIKKLINTFRNKEDCKPYFLIDGRFNVDFGKDTKQVIGGDLQCYSIAKASIIAKVKRDHVMNKLAIKYKGYGFEKHKGYGTKLHTQKLEELGACPIHRKSFKPVLKFVKKY